MAIIINERQMIENNIFKYEERLNSKFTRFLDKTPVFVTYYHINSNDSTVDPGFQNVESVIGNKSPLKFNCINEFPLFGLDQIVIQLEDTEHGLDGSYEGDAVILPNTIKPLEDDFFIINHLKRSDSYMFRVTAVDYDNIKANNYYKISFKLEYIDGDKNVELEKQVIGNYDCSLENIGTENKCIIEHSYVEKIAEIDTLYSKILELFMTLFYNERYNSLISINGDGINPTHFYDPYMTMFINKHGLINYNRNNLSTVILNLETNDNAIKMKYEKSFYRYIETLEINRLCQFEYQLLQSKSQPDSIFSRWYDSSVFFLEIPSIPNYPGMVHILSQDFIDCIRNPSESHEFNSSVMKLIYEYITKELTVYDIPTTIYDEIVCSDVNLELFFITPVILYIIQQIKESYLKNNTDQVCLL